MKKQRGFTLVEILVATAIFGVISTVIVAAYIGSQRSFITGAALLDLQGQTRQAVNWLRNDLKWACYVESSHPFSGQTYTTSNTELVLRLPSVQHTPADGSLAVINGFDYVIYHLNDNDPTILERIVDVSTGDRPGGIFTLANNVSVLNFSSGGTNLGSVGSLASLKNVTVSLTTAKTVLGSRLLQSTAATSITLRNRYF